MLRKNSRWDALILLLAGVGMIFPPSARSDELTNTAVEIKLTYKGLFRMPFYPQPLTFEGVQIAYDGDNALYYGGGRVTENANAGPRVGKAGIVEAVIPVNGDLSKTNIAVDLVAPVEATRGRVLTQIQGYGPVLTGLAVGDDQRLYLNHGRYYDVGDSTEPGFCSVDLDLSKDNFGAFPTIDFQPAKTMAGSLLVVPLHWQLRTQFKFLAGEYWNSNGGGPNTRGFVVDAQNRIISTGVLFYGYRINPIDNFLLPDRHFGSFGISIAGENYYGVTAKKAMAPSWYGAQVDPISGALDECSPYKGYHADSYRALLYFFNEKALTQAAALTAKNVRPITVDITSYMQNPCSLLGGAASHGTTLYVLEGTADKTRSVYSVLPVVHVFEVTAGGAGNGGVLPGDVNQDGMVNLRDAIQLLRWIAGQPGRPESGTDRFLTADVNRDGRLTLADFICLLRGIMAGGTLPC